MVREEEQKPVIPEYVPLSKKYPAKIPMTPRVIIDEPAKPIEAFTNIKPR
jgi:hypothetical protein